MAVTETVKIVFEADTKAITDTTKELTSLKKATEEDVAAFKKLSDETKNLNNTLSTTDDNFVSLRTQVKQAKDEVVRLSAEFGEFSAEAQAARVKAGQLADQMSDLNRQVNLLNPEAKAKAFVNFGNQIVGAFQIATGALQAFGAENEQVAKLAMRLQGALNVAQGIASLKGLKEGYQDLKVVLGFTTAAQNTMTAATTTGTAATGGFTASLKALRVALLSNPITAVAVAVGALAGAFLLATNNTDENTEATEENTRAQEENRKEYIKGLDERSRGINFVKDEVAVLKGELTPLQAKLNELTRKRREELSKTFDIAGRTQINEYYDLLEQRERLLDAQRKKTTPPIPPRPKSIDLTLEAQALDNATQQLTEQINTALDAIQPETVKIGQTAYELNKELFKKTDELQKKKFELYNQLAQESFDFVFSLNRASLDAQQNDLEKQREKGLITEEQYQEKLKQLKTKQAKADKEAQIFSAIMSTAQAIINALTVQPATLVPTAVAVASTVGALNLAKIIATPLPKFKQGTLSVPGVDTGQDTVMAMLRPGEAVIPTETNREYAPALRAIYRRDINAKELNDFVTNREQGAFAFNQVSLDALYKRDLKVSALTQAGKSAQLTAQPTKITADVDVQQLSRAMSKNKAVEVTNTAALGEAIAAQLSKRINPRQVI